MTGYTCAWCGEGHLGVDCPLPKSHWPHFRNDEARRLVPRLQKLVKALQERVDEAYSRNNLLWNIIEEASLGNTRLRQENAALRRELNSIVESAFDTMTRNCHLRQELLERAEAHEEALRHLPLYEEDEGEYAEYREYTDYERRLLGVDK